MDMLIGGKHISSEDLVDVENPYTGEVIDTVPIAHRQTAQLAIDAANDAKESLVEMSAFKISNKLLNVVAKLEERREEFAQLLCQEVGKPINEALVEVDRSIETLRLSAEEAKRIYGESVPLDAGLNGKGFFAFTQRLPLGVVAAITPFNYPLNLTIHKIAPAIACKNTVIVKPPTEAPLAVMKFCELLDEEFPDGVVNVVTGYGSEIGDYLVCSSEVDKISFTGSVTTGMMISQKAGMKKVTLELGGNDPVIILKDADLDKAVKGIINGAFLNAGQVCMGVKRLIVEDCVADELGKKLSGYDVSEDIADVLYTTGTTGRSKGVMISHRTIIADAENLIEGQGFTPELTFIISGPLNHIGSLSKIYPVIMLGGTLLIIDGMRDMSIFFHALDYPAEKMATFFVPANVRMLTQFGAERLASYAEKIDFIECGGAPLPHSDMLELCNLLPNTRLYNTYASTETGIISTYNYNDGRCLSGCLGKPMKHSRIFITDEGRIACQGDTLMSGYIGDSEMTARVMRNGVIYTADCGRIDECGRLHLTGRADDIINVGGFKVSPSEVEDAAMAFDGIADCICIAAQHPVLGTVTKLLYVAPDGCEIDLKALASFLKSKLEAYKVPMFYSREEKIQRTYNGKLNRKYYL